MITLKATLEALPNIASPLIDVTGVEIDSSSARTMTLDTALARMTAFNELLKTDMLIGSLERSAADMLRDAMQFGVTSIAGFAKADLSPLPKESQAQIGKTSLTFVRNAIYHSTQQGHPSPQRHVKQHAESYRKLLPIANVRTRRHIRRLLHASEY